MLAQFFTKHPMNAKKHICPIFKFLPHTTRSAAFIGLFCISTAATSLAAFETLPEATVKDPGISLGSGTGGFTGTVIDAHDRLFNVSTDFAGFSNGPAAGAGAYAVGTKSVFSADRDEGSTGSVASFALVPEQQAFAGVKIWRQRPKSRRRNSAS